METQVFLLLSGATLILAGLVLILGSVLALLMWDRGRRRG